MDNQAMRDDAKQSNSTHPNSKILVHMESAVSSVMSTQELVEGNSAASYSPNSTAGKLRAMISSCSRKLLLAFICLLSIGILTMTLLYVLENHRTEKTTTTTKVSSTTECLEYTPETILTELPKELRDILPRIESQITLNAQANGFKAVSYGIAYNGKLWWTFHYGRRNFSVPSSPQPNNDTPYPAASLSKLFTAVMLMKLIENGTITSIDDTVDKYDPEFKVKNPFNKERITFRQLLCMKSGLPREAPCNPPKQFNFCPYNTTEMWRRISKVDLEVRPNMASVYSNLGFAILGRVMGRIMNGTSYEDWMKRELFDKIGLRNTGFNVRQRYSSIPASQDADKKISRIIDWGWLRPAGGIYTSINDLHKFVNVLIERLNTTFLKKSSKRFIFRNEYGEPLGCPAAIWQMKTGETIVDKSIKKYHKQTFYIANGLTIGYTSQIRLSPQNTLATYGLCADGSNYLDFLRLDQSIGVKVYSAVAKALKSKEEKYKAPSNMQAYVGTYKLTSYWPLIKQNLIVRIKNGRLNMVLEWFSADLTYISPWTLKTVQPLDTTVCKDALLANGLLNNIYFFQEPADGKSKCPGVYVRSISAFGYASFVRA